MDMNDVSKEVLNKTMEFFHLFKESGPKVEHAFHGEIFILKTLIMDDRPFLPGELSSAMHMSTARVAMTLRGLECKGMIERNVDRKDRRKVLVTITEQGKEQVAKIDNAFLTRMRRIIDELGREDVGEYIRIVGRLIDITKRLGNLEQE